MDNFKVKEIYEHRRQCLQRLAGTFGRGGIARVAREIDVEANYISRALYPPGRAGKKNIGDELVVKLNEKFPGWLNETFAVPGNHDIDTGAQEPNAPTYAHSNPTIAQVIALMELMDDGDQLKVLGLATHLELERSRAPDTFNERTGT